MATFTSVTDGNWNDGATWGNTSPGSKGTDWPGVAGDIVNIGTTSGQSHDVTYNVSETAELGTVTIGATGGTGYSTLSFLASMSTLLCIGTGTDLVINASGKLYVGTSTTPIDAAYTAEIRFNTNNDNARGFYNYLAGGGATGAEYHFYGDPDYYGNDYDTTLASNWTSGSTFTVVGDFTTAWKAGQLLYVHKGATYAARATDTAAVTILSMAANGSNTDITVNEAFTSGTFNAGGDVFNLSRNVKLTKSGASSAIDNNNTNRWRFYDGGGYNATGFCAFSNVELVGNYRFNVATPIICERIVIRNSSDGPLIQSHLSANVSMIVASTSVGNSGCRGVKFTDSVFICQSQTGLYGAYKCEYDSTCRVLGSGAGIGASPGYKDTIFSGCVYSCGYSVYDAGSYILQNASVNYNSAGTNIGGTNDIRMSSYQGATVFRSCKVPTLTFYNRNNSGTPCFAYYIFENYNRVLGDHRVYGMYGDAIKVDADGTSDRPEQRSGGGEDLFEIVTQSYCNAGRMFERFLDHQIWALSGVSKTYRYYIQTDYVSLPATEIELKAEYINDATNHTYGSIVSDEAITTRSGDTDWSQYVEVTVNPSEDCWVRLSMKIMGYESTKKIWIDPKVVIS